MNPAARSLAEYDRRVHQALAYIDTHLDESIDIERLAKQANFSPFHFHRLFSALVGETMGSYLTRRRVETAAARLASQPRLSILEVALAVGFSSNEAFSRAFRKRFGRSPSAWRDAPADSRAKNSKASQVDRNPDQATAAEVGYRSGAMKTTTTPLHVKVQNRPAVRIAYLRYQGPFGPAVGRFWHEKVAPWLEQNDLLGVPRYGVSQDDPEITEPAKCRYDAGAEVDANFVPSRGAQIATIPGGLYGSTRFYGTSAEIPETWRRILREWLPESGYQLDARPCFEYYPTDGKYDEKTGAFECELCIPLAKL